MGVLGGDDHQAGLLPRAVRQIFERIVDDESGAEFAVSCSFLEIYKEVVRDLLNPTLKPGGLPIREDVRDKSRGVYVEGLTEVYVMGEADVLECMSCGNANRVVGATLMNAQSSRSHALLTITLQQKMPDGSTKVSKLNVADLAGSEKVRSPISSKSFACQRGARGEKPVNHAHARGVREMRHQLIMRMLEGCGR